MRILIAEDDPHLGAHLVRGLRDQSYAVDLAVDGDEALHRIALNSYDAILLDMMLPKRDGISVARAVRLRGVHTPILMLTARDAIADRVAGLDGGADDYLVKPFAFEELLARIRALTRRAQAVLDTVIVVGALTIDTRTHRVTKDGRSIELTAKEYALVEFLARHVGALLTRAEITAHVWDDNHDPLSNTLEVYINRLRNKLDGTAQRSFIRTTRGAGYCLVAPPTTPDGASDP